MRKVLVIIFSLVATVSEAQIVTHGMTIPDTSGGVYEFLVADATRRAAMKSRWDASPSTYPTGTTSNPTGCFTNANGSGCTSHFARQATAYAIQERPRTCGGTVSAGTVIDNCQEALAFLDQCYTDDCWPAEEDSMRYFGEDIILGVAYLWDELDATQRTNWIQRIVQRIIFLRSEGFGDGCNSPFIADRISNYNWGFFRNQLLFGVAFRQLTGYTMPATGYDTASVNPTGSAYALTDWNNDDLRDIAQEMLDDADCRIDNLNSTMNSRRGGSYFDGRSYGQYLYQYFALPFVVMDDLGRAAIDESGWYADSIWQVAFSLSPKSTYHESSAGAFTFQLNSYGATNLTSGRMGTDTIGAGNFFTAGLILWDGLAIEPYLRYLLTNFVSRTEPWMRLADPDYNAAGTSIEAGGFDTDWFAPSGMLVLRNTLTDTSGPKLFYINLGMSLGHHLNKDGGSMQMLNCGTGASADCYWTMKEASCYGLSSNLLPQTDGDLADCFHQWGQNSVSINHVNNGTGEDEPTVLRLDKEDDYVYACTDLLAADGLQPGTAHIRCFTYVRARNYVITHDRIAVTGSFPKVEMVRCPVAFTNPATGLYRCTMNSAQVADHFFLSGGLSSQSIAYTTRDEGAVGSGNCTATNGSNCDPQYRVEGSVTDTDDETHVITVHHARNASDTVMDTPSISIDGSVITVTVTVDGVTDTITFNTGTTDTGGTISVAGGQAITFAAGISTVTSSTSTYAWDSEAPVSATGFGRFRLLKR